MIFCLIHRRALLSLFQEVFFNILVYLLESFCFDTLLKIIINVFDFGLGLGYDEIFGFGFLILLF